VSVVGAVRGIVAVLGEAMTIKPGAVVTCKQTGQRRWVVQREVAGRWCLRGTRRNERGRRVGTARVAGAGDLTVVSEPRAYQPGETFRQNGVVYSVVADLDHEVEFVAGPSRVYLRDGVRVFVAGGNRVRVPKSDLEEV
jgi:hypothetical protein